jgi:uncharacterized protein YoxC
MPKSREAWVVELLKKIDAVKQDIANGSEARTQHTKKLIQELCRSVTELSQAIRNAEKGDHKPN